MINNINIYPLHEYLLEFDKDKICDNILKNKYTQKQMENVNEDIETIKNGNYLSKIDKYIDDFYTKTETIIDYLKKDSLIIIDEKNKISAREKNIKIDYENLIKSLIEKEKVVPQILQDVEDIENLKEKVEEKQIIYLQNQNIDSNNQNIKYLFNYREVNYYKSEIESFIKDINNAIVENKHVTIVVDNKEKAKKLSTIFNDYNILNYLMS